MKKILLFILFPFISFSQIQIGSDINGKATNDASGSNVALSSDGTVMAIGAPGNDDNGIDSGQVRVYRNQNGVWTQIGSDIDGEAAGDQSAPVGISGLSLSSDGMVVAIGATGNDDNGIDSGHVRIYQNQNGIWTQIGSDIDGEAANDASGLRVSLSSDGAIVAIGAFTNDGNGIDSGHVRVYQNQNGVWTQIGSDIDGEAAGDTSGSGLSLSSDGTIIAIGANRNDGNGFGSGHVRVYRNQSGVWIQIGSDIDGEAANDGSGGNVALSSDGTIVAIGANANDGNGNLSGHVRVYQIQNGEWTQIGSDIDGEAAGDNSSIGLSLSSDGTIVAIGAPTNDGNGINSGHVRVYQNLNDVWTQISTDIDGEAAGDTSGISVSLSSNGRVVAIGAPGNDGSGIDSGHVRVYDLSSVLSSNDFALSRFILFPNPTKEQFTIQLRQGLELQKVNIYDNVGQLLYTSAKSTVNISSLSQGVYFVEIVSDRGKVSKKILVE